MKHTPLIIFFLLIGCASKDPPKLDLTASVTFDFEKNEWVIENNKGKEIQ